MVVRKIFSNHTPILFESENDGKGCTCIIFSIYPSALHMHTSIFLNILSICSSYAWQPLKPILSSIYAVLYLLQLHMLAGLVCKLA